MPRKYPVKQGECLDSIAFRERLKADRIWNLEENRKLKDERKDPNVLAPNDVLTVLEFQSDWIDGKKTNKKHTFRLELPTREYRIQALLAGLEVPDLEYTVEIDDKSVVFTQDKGWITCKIPPNAVKAVVKIKGWGSYEVELGFLDPPEVPEGIERRLSDLGYLDRLPDGVSKDAKNGRILFETTHAISEEKDVSKQLRALTADKMD